MDMIDEAFSRLKWDAFSKTIIDTDSFTGDSLLVLVQCSCTRHEAGADHQPLF